MKLSCAAGAVIAFAFIAWPPALVGEEEKEAPSPAKTTTEFLAGVHEGSADKALKLAADWKELRAPEVIGEMVKEAKANAGAARPRVVDEKTLGDVAVVIIGTEGRGYRTGIDLDPVFLTRREGKWLVVPAPIPPVALEAMIAAASDKEQTQKQLMELGRWYADRKKAIYKERERNAAKPK